MWDFDTFCRPALRLMHGLLLSNVDTLALDASPASHLPSPANFGPNRNMQKAVLAWFLSLMAEVSLHAPFRYLSSGLHGALLLLRRLLH